MKQLLVIAAASLIVTSAAHAQTLSPTGPVTPTGPSLPATPVNAVPLPSFTGGFAEGGVGSYSSTSITFGSRGLYQGGDGTFAPLDSVDLGLIPITNSSATLDGANPVTLTANLPTFSFADISPTNQLSFEITSIIPQSTPGVFEGAGLFVDGSLGLAPTPGTYALAFSGPAAYSFSAGVPVVPEPSTWALLIGGLGVMAFFRACARRAQTESKSRSPFGATTSTTCL